MAQQGEHPDRVMIGPGTRLETSALRPSSSPKDDPAYTAAFPHPWIGTAPDAGGDSASDADRHGGGTCPEACDQAGLCQGVARGYLALTAFRATTVERRML